MAPMEIIEYIMIRELAHPTESTHTDALGPCRAVRSSVRDLCQVTEKNVTQLVVSEDGL